MTWCRNCILHLWEKKRYIGLQYYSIKTYRFSFRSSLSFKSRNTYISLNTIQTVFNYYLHVLGCNSTYIANYFTLYEHNKSLVHKCICYNVSEECLTPWPLIPGCPVLPWGPGGPVGPSRPTGPWGPAAPLRKLYCVSCQHLHLIVKYCNVFADSFINMLHKYFFLNIPQGLWNQDHRQCP